VDQIDRVDQVDQTRMSRHEAVAQLTAPGAAFEMTTAMVNGYSLRIYRNTSERWLYRSTHGGPVTN
jgi:hypothetical protein